MKPNQLQIRVLIIFALIVLAAAMRLLPHPPNFTPIAAIALFGGAYLSDRRLAFVIPLLVMLLSDIILGFHNTMIYVYASLAAMVWIGTGLKGRISLIPVFGAAIGSALLFFIITNFGVWLSARLYPLTWEGLMMCYVVAIPFFHYMLAGTLFYTAILFGSFEFIKRQYPEIELKAQEINSRV